MGAKSHKISYSPNSADIDICSIPAMPRLNSFVLDGSNVDGFDEKIEIEEDEKDEIMYGKRCRGKLGRGKEIYEDEDSQFKSKNLHAERRRRARLSSNLLHLRSLVPIITNMNKETIVKDAITYIEVLQREVENLTELLELEASNPNPQEERKMTMDSDFDSDDQDERLQIQPDVKVVRIGADKLWMKVTFEKRTGRLTQIMEAIHSFGYQMTDISFTATKGAATFTSCLEEMLGVFRSPEETRDILMGII